MAWYLFLGFGTFWLSLIISIILYAVKRKWYAISYLICVSLYVFTVGFVIDAFDLSKNWILFILALSTAMMIRLGIYLSKNSKAKK